ncbi:MAG: hypothetical protein IPI19_02090 [Ignavibacteriales bacterium]|nr:hypothetical protein [Ignavibacteriales bacterium]MBP9120629.1 hypothetical protein [Ignavibacterium sp.]
MKILFSFLPILILIYGCGTGRQFTVNPATDLKIDSTKVFDVETLFGKPEEVKTIDENNVSSKIHVYFYAQKPGYFSYVSMKNLELEFIKNTLNGYIYQNSFGEPNTNFTDTLKNIIEIGVSKKNDVLSVFGEPSGKTNLPTNLINYTLGLNTVKIVPEANDAWVYSLKYFEDVYSTPKPYYKFLIFFFNSDQKVIDKYYVSNITREVIKPKISEH